MNTLTASPLLWIGFVILLVLLMIVVVVIHERDPHEKPWFQEHPHWLEKILKHLDD